jgi:hypothetical protein
VRNNNEKNDPLKACVKEVRRRVKKFKTLLAEYKRLSGTLVDPQHSEFKLRMRNLQICEDRLTMRAIKLKRELAKLPGVTEEAYDSLRPGAMSHLDRYNRGKLIEAIELQEEGSALFYMWEMRWNCHSVEMMCAFEEEWDRVSQLPSERKYVVLDNHNQTFEAPFMTLLEARKYQSYESSVGNMSGDIYDVSELMQTGKSLKGQQIFEKGKEVHVQGTEWRDTVSYVNRRNRV